MILINEGTLMNFWHLNRTSPKIIFCTFVAQCHRGFSSSEPLHSGLVCGFCRWNVECGGGAQSPKEKPSGC